MINRREPLRRLFVATVLSVMAAAAAVAANPLGLNARAMHISRPFTAQTTIASPFDFGSPAAPAMFADASSAAGGGAEEAGCGLPFQRSCSPCGGNGQRACTVTERIPSCNGGLVEIAGCSGDCTGPIFDSSGTCVALSACGGEGERACTITEGTACQSGLAEIAGCVGDCRGPVFNSSGMCTAVSPCGGKGQRACTIGERVPSCNSGLIEIPGCTGNCQGVGGLVSAGMCTAVESIAEPGINGSDFTVGQCSMSGYMDMHMHQFAHLAHGGGVLAGTPYDSELGVNESLKGDFTTSLDLVNPDGSELHNWSHGVGIAETDGLIAGWLQKVQFDLGNFMQWMVPCDTNLWGSRCANQDYFHAWHDPLLGDSVGSFIGTKDGAGFSSMGAPLFNGWPKWSSTTHQQVYYKWLERAWRGGLRMMTELAVTNEALCRGNKRVKGADCGDSMESIDAQIQAAKEFQTFIDNQHGGPGQGWYRIVTTPLQAREAIARGKMAVILGIETAEIFNCYEWGTCSETFITTKVNEYYDKGVRVIFPIHNFDNAFGAAATWQDGIEVGQRLVEKRWWDTRNCGNEGYTFELGGFTQTLISLLRFSTSIDPSTIPDRPYAACNQYGLRPLGTFFIQKLMDKGMIIDVDHMSNIAFDQALSLAENRPGGKYPGIVASHVLSFDRHMATFMDGNDVKKPKHERLRTAAQLQRIKGVGGMVAAMLKDDGQDTDNKGKKYTLGYPSPQYGPAVADDCRHSSRTFAHAYQYLVDQMDGPVAFGSDFNGVAGHIGPRFGIEGCGSNVDERGWQIRNRTRMEYPFSMPGFGTFGRQVTGHRTFDYNYDGMAHVGMLPDFVQDLKQVGIGQNYVNAMFGSAEAYVRMWEGVTATTPDTSDDTPAAVIADTCANLETPDITFTTAPATTFEGDTTTFRFTGRRDWTIGATCSAPNGKVHSQSFSMLHPISATHAEFQLSCVFAGGNWGAGGDQIGTVTVTASKGQNNRPPTTRQVQVLNRAPQLTGNNFFSVPWGKPAIVSLNIADAPGENIELRVEWDAFSAPLFFRSPGPTTVQHLYPHPSKLGSPYSVRLEATDNEGGVHERFISIDVVGLPPVITLSPDNSVAPMGETQTYTFTKNDPDGGTVTLTGWSCGDGVLLTPFNANATSLQCRFDHPVTDNPVTVTGTDDDGRSGTGTALVDSGFPPNGNFTGVFVIDEGGEINGTINGSPTSSDKVELVFNSLSCGQGQQTFLGNDQFPGLDPKLKIAFTCRYPDGPVTQPITARITNNLQTRTLTIFPTVNNLPPFVAVDVLGSPILQGQSTNFMVNFGDPGLDDVTVDINWGDGSTVQQLSGGNDNSPFFLAHTWATPGTFTITAIAVDSDGAATTTTRQIVVLDRTPPVVTIIAATPIEATGPGGAPVAFTASATDNFDATVTASCNFISGTTKGLGSHVITCTATDAAGNQGSATANVTVIDTTPPTVTVNAPTPVEATSPNGAPVAYIATASDLVDGSRPVTCSVATNTVRPLGATLISCTASDTRNNEGSGSATVNVQDTTPPVLTVPTVPLVEATGPGGAPVSFSVTAVDVVDTEPTIDCTPGSGGIFGVGPHTVWCWSIDDWGNGDWASFDIQVADQAPPQVTITPVTPQEAISPQGAPASFTATAVDNVDGPLQATCNRTSGSTFALGDTVVTCTATDTRNNVGSASITVKVIDTTPPALTVPVHGVTEATGPLGAIVVYAVGTASDIVDGTVPVTCAQAPGTQFPIGGTVVTCSATDTRGNQAQVPRTIAVADTTPPVVTGQNASVMSPNPNGVPVTLAVSATDTVAGNVPVTCTPVNGSVFPLGQTPVTCTATDGYNNTGSGQFTVTVAAPTTACVAVDFREITYFNNSRVITSSDQGIRLRNGITGPFDPALWPYSSNGRGQTTKSRGTLFRLYGFKPNQAGKVIYNTDDPAISYLIKADPQISGAFYADLGGPAKVSVCADQLHDYVLAGEKGNGHKNNSNLLPEAQRNVPGIMLNHNSQILKVPSRIRRDLRDAGLPAGERGLIDYIGVQLQGNGNAQFREFVDVEVSFLFDSDTDVVQHFKYGFHTATNTNFETFAGCNYQDSAPGNDSVRLTDLWSPNRSSNRDGAWEACGDREPRRNQRVRAGYDVPYNAIQLLPTVNSATDTLRLFFGPIQPVPEKDWTKKGHKHDWRDWDDEDDRYERDRRGRTDDRRDDKGRKNRRER